MTVIECMAVTNNVAAECICGVHRLIEFVLLDF